MTRTGPINTRPWRRPPWRRRSRGNQGFWFVPPVSQDNADPRQSCWSDDDIALGNEGNSGGLPSVLIMPLVWNLQGGFDPDAIGIIDGSNPSRLKAHPFSDKFFIERIVGDIMLQGQHIDTGLNDCTPTGPIQVNMSLQQTAGLGDAVVIFDPEQNDDAVARRRIKEVRCFVAQSGIRCHDCAGQVSGDDATFSTGIPYSQVFGVPTAKVLHIDWKRLKISVKPEMTLSLVVTMKSPCVDEDALFLLSKLKVWIRKAN